MSYEISEISSSQVDLQVPHFVVHIDYKGQTFPVEMAPSHEWLSDFKDKVIAAARKHDSMSIALVTDHKYLELIRVYDDPKQKPTSSFPFEDQYYDTSKINLERNCHFQVNILTPEEHAKRTADLEKETENDDCYRACGRCLCCPCFFIVACFQGTCECCDACDRSLLCLFC